MTSHRGGLRLLVVENDVFLRLLVEDMLVELGHEVVGRASTAQAAIAVAEEKRPDVVLMDIELDGVGDGVDAARAIRNRLGTPSLFLTGATDSDTHARALVTCPLGFLRKPVTLADLATALASAREVPNPPSSLQSK